MKKILSIAFAGLLAILAISCGKEEKAVFRASDAIAPVLGNVTVADTIKVAYTPAVFKMSFNDSMATYHTLGLVKIDSTKANITLKAAKNDTKNNVISIAPNAIATVLLAKGCEPGAMVNVSIVVRASIQDPAKGVTNGYLDSEDSYELAVYIPSSGKDPYAGWATSSWGVTGSIASTGNNWGNSGDADIPMVTDGTWHVAKGVVLTPDDEFKFRFESAWAKNFGGTFVEIDAEFNVTQGGDNIKVKEAGTYDLFLDPEKGVAKIIVTGSNIPPDPYEAFTTKSTWGVTGAIASTGNNWGNSGDADIAMLTDGTWHVAKEVELTTTDEIKFRENSGWDKNFGGTLVEVGVIFDVTQGGDNIKVLADGKYDLLLNPEEKKALIVVSGDDPGLSKPEPEPSTGTE